MRDTRIGQPSTKTTYRTFASHGSASTKCHFTDGDAKLGSPRSTVDTGAKLGTAGTTTRAEVLRRCSKFQSHRCTSSWPAHSPLAFRGPALRWKWARCECSRARPPVMPRSGRCDSGNVAASLARKESGSSMTCRRCGFPKRGRRRGRLPAARNRRLLAESSGVTGRVRLGALQCRASVASMQGSSICNALQALGSGRAASARIRSSTRKSPIVAPCEKQLPNPSSALCSALSAPASRASEPAPQASRCPLRGKRQPSNRPTYSDRP